MDKIYNIPLSNHYLKDLAKIIHKEDRISLVLLPNNRSCLALKKELSKLDCISPEIISISDLLSLPNIDFIPAKFLRERIPNLPFSTLYDLSESLTILIKKFIINEIDCTKLAVPTKFNENWKHTLSIIEEIFKTNEIIEIKQNLEVKLDRIFSRLNQKNILIAGLLESNFYTEKLYQMACNVITVVSGAEIANGENYKKIRKSLKISLDSFTKESSNSNQREIIELSNVSDESIAISIAVRKMLFFNKTVMVVCPNSVLRERLQFEMLKWNILPDDSLGQPFYKTLSGQIISQIITVLKNNFCNADVINLLKYNDSLKPEVLLFENFLRSNEGYPLNLFQTFDYYNTQKPSNFTKAEFEVSEMEQNDFHSRCIINEDSYNPEYCLNQKKFSHSSLSETFHALNRVVEKLKFFSKFKKKDSLFNWINYFADFASIINPNTGKDFIEILDDFKSNQFDNISLEEFCTFTHKHLMPISVRKNTNFTSGVIIVGILEAQLLDADLVIICSANENSWRVSSKSEIWMSKSMMLQSNIFSLEDKRELYRCIWERLLHRPNVLITRSLVENGEKTQIYSGIRNIQIKKADWLEKILLRIKEPLVPSKIAFIPPSPPVESRPRSFWVSDLDLLINNPYVFYAKKILKLRELNQINESKNLRGNLVHEVLEAFVKNSANKKDYDKLVEISESIMQSKSIHPEILGLWYFSKDEIYKFFIEHLDNNVKSFPEIKGSMALSIPFNQDTISVQISAKADRIDIDESGNMSIIDYKTGEAPSVKSVKDGEKIQLPIESVIAARNGFNLGKNNVEKMAFLQLKPKNLKIIEISRTCMETNKICENTLSKIKSLIERYNVQCEPYSFNIEDKYNHAYAHLARIKEIYDA